MAHNIVELDIDRIDADIVRHQTELDRLRIIRNYALQVGKRPSAPAAQEPVLTSSIIPTDKSRQMKVSPFIIDYLTHTPRVDTKTIVQAFALHTQKNEEEVSNNVSNALSRLKTEGQIEAEERTGGRKAGNIWFIKPKTE